MEAGQAISEGVGRVHAFTKSSAWPLNSSVVNTLFLEGLEPPPLKLAFEVRPLRQEYASGRPLLKCTGFPQGKGSS